MKLIFFEYIILNIINSMQIVREMILQRLQSLESIKKSLNIKSYSLKLIEYEK